MANVCRRAYRAVSSVVGSAPCPKAVSRTTSSIGSSRINNDRQDCARTEDERAAVIKGKDDLEGIANVLSDYDDQSPHDIYQTWPQQAYSMSDTCSTLIAALHRTNERNPEITPLKNSRQAAISTLNDFRSAIIGLVQIFRHDTSGPDYEHGEDDIPEDESKARRPRVDAMRELWEAAAADLESELNAEISMIWRRVRQLERIAIGPD
jgi:hypothetical protein